MSRRLFTSDKYWFEFWEKIFIKTSLESTGTKWIVGLGIPLSIIEKLSIKYNMKDVSVSTIRWAKVWQYNDLTLISLVGGAGYAEAIVALAAKRGVKTLVGVGYCGALQKELSMGDLVIAYAARREDGLTNHYVDLSYPAVADPRLVNTLYTLFSREKRDPKLGIVVSRSSTFTESQEWVNKMNNLNIKCVDVETSTILLLSSLTGISSSTLLLVSDNLITRTSSLISEKLDNIAFSIINKLVHYFSEE